MKWLGNSRNFASCIRSPEAVRDVFRTHRLFHWWWLMILRLHGKPVRQDTTPARVRAFVADGLAFYAGLYRLLAIILLALLTSVGILSEESGGSVYLILAAASGGFLWATTSLGFRGVDAYRNGEKSGRTLLVVFVVLLTWFLIACAILSSACLYHRHACPLWVNVAATAVFVMIGVGSYCIELIYLVAAGEP